MVDEITWDIAALQFLECNSLPLPWEHTGLPFKMHSRVKRAISKRAIPDHGWSALPIWKITTQFVQIHTLSRIQWRCKPRANKSRVMGMWTHVCGYKAKTGMIESSIPSLPNNIWNQRNKSKINALARYQKWHIWDSCAILNVCPAWSYGSAEGPPRVVENRNLLSHPDDLRKEAYLIRMT